MTRWIDRSTRARLRILGPDRAKFLHNLATQDVKRLEPGQGAEAFVTSPQGKTLAYVTLHVLDDEILVRADAGGLDDAIGHFQKYGIFDDVRIELSDQADSEVHVVVDDLDGWLAERDLPIPGDSDCAIVGSAGRVIVIRESPTGSPGVTLIAGGDALKTWLHDVAAMAAEEFESLRIQAGTPVWGREVSTANLPQEIGRDSRAISFTKGCYLGQETVARLDALGHVNKILRGLVFDCADAPPSGTPLVDEKGNPAGTVTSSAAGSPAIGLGIVKTRHAEHGSRLRYDAGEVRVVTLPIVDGV